MSGPAGVELLGWCPEIGAGGHWLRAWWCGAKFLSRLGVNGGQVVGAHGIDVCTTVWKPAGIADPGAIDLGLDGYQVVSCSMRLT